MFDEHEEEIFDEADIEDYGKSKIPFIVYPPFLTLPGWLSDKLRIDW